MKRHNSIRWQIMVMILSITMVSIVVTSVALAFFTIKSFKDTRKDEALGSIQFTAEYCVAPLLFDDATSAQRILSNYRSVKDVEAAILYTRDHKVFAQYSQFNTNITMPEYGNELPYASYDNKKLYVITEIKDGDEILGILSLKISTSTLQQTIITYISYIVLMLLIITTVTYKISQKNQKRITEPILELVRVVENIKSGSEENFELLLNPSNEIGLLGDRFHEMMDRIKASEIQQKKMQILLHDIIESMPSLLIVIDNDDTIIMNNDSAQTHSSGDLTKGISLFEAFPATATLIPAIREAQNKKIQREVRNISLNMGEIEYADVTLFSLTDPETSGLVINIADVTELVQKDNQLSQIQKMETMGTLAGGIAHDFNNIMSGIVGTISLIEMMEEQKNRSPELRSYIQLMKDSSDRAINLISQLLSLSHKSDTKRSYIDIVKSIDTVSSICRNSIDKSVEIQKHLPSSPLMVFGDASQIEQILLNIAVNGAHAMTIMQEDSSHRGGVLSINCNKIHVQKEKNLFTGSLAPGDYVHIEISDTGIGINDLDMKRIFDPFYTTKDKGKGTGLGLSMAYNIIEKNDGHLNLTSKVGIGTTFELYFPIAATQQMKLPVKNDVIKKFQRTGTVLIIDDDTIIHVIAKKMLEKAGFNVVITEDGMAGLGYYRSHQESIDIIILDMAMPGLSGNEVYRRLLEINKEVKVLLSSGFSQDERVQEAMAMGVNGFLHKPYHMEDLIAKVDEVLNS